MKKLTIKQQRFVEAYSGDIRKAAKLSGISYPYARQLMVLAKHRHIVDAIRKRERTLASKNIATRTQRQIFWTETMRDEETNIRDRLKASELLGKSEADFVERRQIEGAGVNILTVIQKIEQTGG